MKCAASLLAIGTLWAVPALADPPTAHYGLPGPEMARTVPEWRAVNGGLVLFGASYAGAIGGAAASDFRSDTAWLAVPVFGPWISIARGTTLNAWGLSLDGLAQLGGATLVAAGFVYPRRVLGPAQGGLRVDRVTVGRSTIAVGGSF